MEAKEAFYIVIAYGTRNYGTPTYPERVHGNKIYVSAKEETPVHYFA